jgi:hypothetical protein
MFLTSPFIDQAISLKSPQGRQMSVIGIYRQVSACVRSIPVRCSGHRLIASPDRQSWRS